MSVRLLLCCWLPALFAPAHAYGPVGHIVAGLAAEPLLCPVARAAVATLGGGVSLADLGLWADRIRGEDRWRHAAPWHYVNIPDGMNPRRFVHPDDGDVVEAIERFKGALADARLPAEERLDALRWVIHLVVDVHQPLHVGRAEDRGGNAIDVRFEGRIVSLHAFWDSEAIALAAMRPRAYAAHIGPRVRRLAATDQRSDVLDWAQESMDLRPAVYAFDTATGRLSAAYLERARRMTEDRLALAAARLANTLNTALCS